MTTVAVIGAGGAGAALVAVLAETEGITWIDVFDPRGNFGGEAFLTPTSSHLCNTSAATMSLDCNDDDHFYRWLGHGVSTPPEETFAPRTVYRQYLTETIQKLAASEATPEIRLHHNQITDIHTGHDGARLKAEDATFGIYSAVVLAPGVQSSSNRHDHQGARNTAGRTRHFASQYVPEFEEFLQENPGREVGIIGTKLSGIDAAKSVLEAGSRATLVSRSGELPAVRQRLPLRSADPLSEEGFAQRSASPDILLDTIGHWFSEEQDRKALTSPGSVREPAAPRLRREIDQTVSGEEWQERVGEFIDLANQVWKRCSKDHLQSLLDACKVWIPRYVSSIPLENARLLERGFHEGSLSVSSLSSWRSAGKHPVDTPVWMQSCGQRVPRAGGGVFWERLRSP